MEQKLYETLKKYWGYDSFRLQQREIIDQVLAGRDVLALMPTGGGKSLTYQLPTMVMEGLCIVITPLVALMKDQVDSLRSKGISAVAIHSGLTYRQIDMQFDNCVYGDVKFLYVSPERLTTEMFRMRVQQMKVALLAVDEAHCISQWGYDFRPSYLRIAELRASLPDVPVLALTASATPQVADDIMKQLEFGEHNTLRSSFARPNLSYVVRHVEDKRAHLMRIINNVEGSGIVYVRLRESAERVAEFLREQGVSASYYHGGLPNVERSIRQDEWLSGKVRIMVATNAFGMGIDKPDVRFVVHYSMCDSLESYYQEAGRAGRDGKRSYAVLLVDPGDHHRIVCRVRAEFPKREVIKSVYEKICSYLQVAIGDGAQCSYIFNIHDFCYREHIHIGVVINVLSLLEQNGYMTFIDEHENPARLMFKIDRDDLYKYHSTAPNVDSVLGAILRLYNGVFTDFRAIDEMEIASFCDLSYKAVHEALKWLWRANIIRYVPANHAPMIYLNEERLPLANLYISPETYTRRKEVVCERLENMFQYAFAEEECRSVILERYFGVENPQPCGVCDNCLARCRDGVESDVSEQVVAALRQKPLSIHEVVGRIKCDPKVAVDSIKALIEEGVLESLPHGVVRLVAEE